MPLLPIDDITDEASGATFDAGNSLTDAKTALKAQGLSGKTGTPEMMDKWQDIKEAAQKKGKYVGKSTELGAGGRAAILKHELLVSGKLGNKTVESATKQHWDRANEISRINFFNKYR